MLKLNYITIQIYLNAILAVYSLEYKSNIVVKENKCFDETCYSSIEDLANSPLVECSYL